MNSSPSHKRGSSWSSSDGSLSWSSRLPVSAGLKICLKLAVALSLKCHWLHLGKVPQTAWQKECSSGGVTQHNLSTAMNSPTTNISHLDCVWQLQLSVSLEASHLTLNLMIWIFNLLECEWHFSISDSLIFKPETLSGCDLTGLRCLRTYLIESTLHPCSWYSGLPSPLQSY